MSEEKLALLVGINHYKNSKIPNLTGCLNDVQEIRNSLEFHKDSYQSPNFHCIPLTSERSWVYEPLLLTKLQTLFEKKSKAALFFFSGHGYWDGKELYLATSESGLKKKKFGLKFSKVMALAEKSRAEHVFIFLDCCHAGGAAEIKTIKKQMAKKASIKLRKDMTIITSSRGHESSSEVNGMGKFTRNLCEALDGDHEDPLGNVTIGGLYRMVTRQFSVWEQSPVLMTNQSSTMTLRKTEPLINPADLRNNLLKYFTSATDLHPLDPEYDHECFKDLSPDDRFRYRENEDKEQAMKFFRKLNSFGMLRPVKEEYLYKAALKSDSVQLTPKGQSYFRMAQLKMF